MQTTANDEIKIRTATPEDAGVPRWHRGVYEVAHTQPALSTFSTAAEDRRQGGGELHHQCGWIDRFTESAEVSASYA